MASLSAREHCDPPNSNSEILELSCGFGGISKNSRRTGLPVTTPLPGKYSSAASNDNAAISTNLANRRLVKPGTAFNSMSTVGKPINDAVKTTGPLTYPPAPTTTSGENDLI